MQRVTIDQAPPVLAFVGTFVECSTIRWAVTVATLLPSWITATCYQGLWDELYAFLKTVKYCLIQNVLWDGALLADRLQQQKFIQCHYVAAKCKWNHFWIAWFIIRGRHFMDRLIQKCPSRPQCHLLHSAKYSPSRRVWLESSVQNPKRARKDSNPNLTKCPEPLSVSSTSQSSE